jgi:hypothetical protein
MSDLAALRDVGSSSLEDNHPDVWKFTLVGSAPVQLSAAGVTINWTGREIGDTRVAATLPTTAPAVSEDGLYEITAHIQITEQAADAGSRKYVLSAGGIVLAQGGMSHNADAAGATFSSLEVSGKAYLRAAQNVTMFVNTTLTAGAEPFLAISRETYLELKKLR